MRYLNWVSLYNLVSACRQLTYTSYPISRFIVRALHWVVPRLFHAFRANNTRNVMKMIELILFFSSQDWVMLSSLTWDGSLVGQTTKRRKFRANQCLAGIGTAGKMALARATKYSFIHCATAKTFHAFQCHRGDWGWRQRRNRKLCDKLFVAPNISNVILGLSQWAKFKSNVVEIA